ncbi:hypothetical protein BCR44DRAFT_45777 [Catenaria anguillulae PL171]|uniref:Uncharacterized protein n=1 Tax=Catenaria anguillulae PL171 TaxID=765915 RepID=A0A1Y2HEK8_9FUNG|nr:hypothetical protein BCR44DRAFT_45777 [Catenaria anguillulae PL171]
MATPQPVSHANNVGVCPYSDGSLRLATTILLQRYYASARGPWSAPFSAAFVFVRSSGSFAKSLRSASCISEESSDLDALGQFPVSAYHSLVGVMNIPSMSLVEFAECFRPTCSRINPAPRSNLLGPPRDMLERLPLHLHDVNWLCFRQAGTGFVPFFRSTVVPC